VKASALLRRETSEDSRSSDSFPDASRHAQEPDSASVFTVVGAKTTGSIGTTLWFSDRPGETLRLTGLLDPEFANAVWAFSPGSTRFTSISRAGWALTSDPLLISYDPHTFGLTSRTLLGNTGVQTSDVVMCPAAVTDSPPKKNERLSRYLERLFEEEAIEDGMEHPAEPVLLEAIRDPTVVTFISDLMRDTSYRHRVALLRCVGRLPFSLAGEWGIPLATKMLTSDDIEIRDAAIRALELWGVPSAIAALRAHSAKEPVKWLADYVRLVVGASH
jgi:hypothetical protein